MIFLPEHHLAQNGDDSRIAPFGQNPIRFAAIPIIGMTQEADNFLAGQFVQIQRALADFYLPIVRWRSRRVADILHLVNSAAAAIPLVGGVQVVGELVTPVGDIETAVRSPLASR